ncbi:MAG: nucleotide pyrophosphohydrolase [Phycisphaerales bacterium]|nr:nucleotide pyrophosphohydrolase [Phycisphaerales bacterium]
MKFSEYQRLALSSDKTGADAEKGLIVTLLGLAGETGSLLSEYKKWFREGDAYCPFADQVSEELGDILWYLANLASKLNLDLGDVAQENLAKIEERWPKRAPDEPGLFGASRHRYDSAYKEGEQLPLQMRVDFMEEKTAEGKKLRLRYKGQIIGDPLTDNSHIDDGYRYHDVFHIGCAILLGWSPVMRRILHCKRKSVPAVDVVEDGARALVTEEGVSAVVFGHARNYSMFEKSATVDYEVLRTVRSMVAPFEVRTRPLSDWEHTILTTFKVWRKLIEYSGGTVIGDSTTGILEFEPPTW